MKKIQIICGLLLLGVSFFIFPTTSPTGVQETVFVEQNHLSRSPDKPHYYRTFEVSAYTLREEECDSDPFIGAAMTDLRYQGNTFASNQLALGTVIEYDGKYWINQDRMNKRYKNNLDLNFIFDLEGARQFGRQRMNIKVFEK